MNKCYTKVIENGCADYQSYYVLGYMEIANSKFLDGILYLKKSIELDSTYASSYYNLAYAYMSIERNDSALKYAKKSLNLYEDTIYKSDAASMIGSIYMSLKDEKNARYYYEISNKISPNNYYTLKPLLYLYPKSRKQKYGKYLLVSGQKRTKNI